jgi:hypothetical protein
MGLFGRKRRGGVRGTARVVSASGAPPNAAYGTLEMHMVVEAPGIPAYSHSYRKMAVRVAKWPSPGSVLPIEVDPTDPRQVDVLWDELPTGRDAGRMQADQLAALLRMQGGGGGAEPQGAPPGVVDQLQQMFPGATVNVAGAPGAPGAPPPPPGAPGAGFQVVANQSGGDPVERLAKLARLRDAGIVDQAQFEQLKAQILDQANLDDP